MKALKRKFVHDIHFCSDLEVSCEKLGAKAPIPSP